MKILSANIKEFGCFENRSFDFTSGFNLIVGSNESGKSTLLSFIKFILYGMPRKTQENSAERDRSISIKGRIASGSLRILLDDGRKITVYRHGVLRVGEKRESYSEECKIIDEQSGAQLPKDRSPGELFLGVPVEVFESTCFVRQMKNTEMDREEVGDSLSNMLLSADEGLDLQRALDKLEAVRKSLLHKNGKGGTLALLAEELNGLEARLERAKADSERMLSCIDTVEAMKKNALERRRELDKLDDAIAAYNSVSVIRRFEKLTQHKNDLSSLRDRLDELNEKYSVNGTLPPRDLPIRAEETLKSYFSASATADAAEKRLAAAKKAKTERKLLCPQFNADAVRSEGGIDAICRSADLLEQKSKKKKSTAILFTALSFASILGGVAATVLLSNILAVGLSLCGAAALFIAIGVVLFSSASKCRSERSALLARWGLSPEDSSATLRNRLNLAIKDEMEERELENSCSIALSALELRNSDLAVATADADRVIGLWRISDSPDRTEALREIASAARSYHSKLDRLNEEISLKKNSIGSLTEELSSYNEADLRARVSAEALASYSETAVGELENRRNFCASAIKSITDRQMVAERELIRLENESEDPLRLSVKIEELRKEYDAEKLRYDSAVAAHEALSTAGANIRDSVTPVVRRTAGELLAEFTDRRYTAVGIKDGCTAVSVEGEGMTASTEVLSAGTRDAVYLSLRLALLDVMYRDERPPIALDEALSQLDDGRAERFLTMLSTFCVKENGQCLLFTCHEREGRLLSDTTGVNLISL